MRTDDEQITVESLTADRVRLEFLKVGDRIAHRVLIADRGSWQSVLESVEGEVYAACPPSPVLQQSQRSRIESDQQKGDAVFLVGAAGANHWSLCASFETPLDDGGGDATTIDRLSFDVACRCRAPSAWLGTTYRLNPSAVAASGGDLSLNGLRLRIRPLPLSASDGFNSCQVNARDGAIELMCLARAAPLPATTRWRYAIEMLE